MFLFACAILGISISIGVSAGNLELIDTQMRLPTPRSRTSAVYDGRDSIYVVGGFSEPPDQGDYEGAARVVKYSFENGTVEEIGTFINISDGDAVIVNDGQNILYFGGWLYKERNRTRNVYQYSLQSGDTSVVAQLPVALVWYSVATDPINQFVYIFGGQDEGRARRTEIYRYEPETHAVTLRGRLSDDSWPSGAVWGNEVIYLFGGHDGKEIMEYEPNESTFTGFEVQLPDRMSGRSAFDEINKDVYILSEYSGNLMKFEPNKNKTELLHPVGWPDTFGSFGSGGMVYVHRLERLYFLGGVVAYSGEPGAAYDRIMYMDIPRPIPTDCSDGETRTIPHPSCCESFLVCFAGEGTKFNCPDPLQFSPVTLQCADPAIVQCGNKYGSD